MQDALAEVLSSYLDKTEVEKLSFYSPYPWQLSFHNLRDDNGEPAIVKAAICGNQVGKTFSCAMEVTWHLTGEYPEYYTGRRFSHPVQWVVGAYTNETCRDICQNELLGPSDDDELLGTGTIPKDLIGKMVRKPGVPNALDSVRIKHKKGWSIVHFRAYEQGNKKFMGKRYEGAWLDEEPPQDIWSQVLRSGLSRAQMIIIMSFTPEQGATDLVNQLLNERKPGMGVMMAGWADAPHLMENPEKLEMIKSQFPPHEVEMRSKGIPMLGSGLVYPVSVKELIVDPFEIPNHWPRICGLDFGWDHPTACCWVAWDRDTDTVYIYDEYKVSREKISTHSSAIKKKGDWIPVAWPHDGMRSNERDGEQLRQLYMDEGVNMLYKKFTNPPQQGQKEGEGGHSIEYGIMEILSRMQTGRFKVFSTCQEIQKELGLYHRKDGRIVDRNDDLMAAMRYAILSLRFATTKVKKIFKTNKRKGLRIW